MPDVMDARFRIGQTVEAMIETVAFGGDGVARVRDMVLFVPFTADGDLAEVRVVEVRKNFLRGKLRRLLIPSPHRTEPECPYYLRCGGCRYQHISYEHQLELKRNQVAESFKRIGRFSSPPVEDIRPSPKSYNYRGKVEIHLRTKRGYPPEIGFIDTGGLRIVDVERCAIADETINNALRELRGKALSGDLPIGGEETKILWSGDQDMNEDGPITRVVKGRKLEVHRQGFFQANLSLTDALVDAVLDLAALTGGERVLDCYCGVGLFSLFLAAKAGDIIAVDIDREAVGAARKNFAAFGHGGVRLFEGSVEDILREHLAGEKGRTDVVVLDPPRTGCDKVLLDTLAEWRPKKVVYVSCDPATQARDIRYLADRGFSLQILRPFDMFPQTKHIEVVALLTWGNR